MQWQTKLDIHMQLKINVTIIIIILRSTLLLLFIYFLNFFWPSVDCSRGSLKIKQIQSGYDHQSVKLETGKLSCNKTALKCCTSTEIVWKRKLVSLASPEDSYPPSQIRQELTGWLVVNAQGLNGYRFKDNNNNNNQDNVYGAVIMT